jgi:hypothetical protein
MASLVAKKEKRVRLREKVVIVEREGGPFLILVLHY